MSEFNVKFLQHFFKFGHFYDLKKKLRKCLWNSTGVIFAFLSRSQSALGAGISRGLMADSTEIQEQGLEVKDKDCLSTKDYKSHTPPGHPILPGVLCPVRFCFLHPPPHLSGLGVRIPASDWENTAEVNQSSGSLKALVLSPGLETRRSWSAASSCSGRDPFQQRNISDATVRCWWWVVHAMSVTFCL